MIEPGYLLFTHPSLTSTKVILFDSSNYNSVCSFKNFTCQKKNILSLSNINVMSPRKRKSRSEQSRQEPFDPSLGFQKASVIANERRHKSMNRRSNRLPPDIADDDSSDSEQNVVELHTSKKTRKSDSGSISKTCSKFLNLSSSKVKSLTQTRTLRTRRSTAPDPSTSSSCHKIFDYFKRVPGEKKPKVSEKVICDDSAPGTSSASSSTATNKHKDFEEKNEAFFERFRHCYGLLGESYVEELDEDKPNYFEKLPEHVIETILCQIPILDLLRCRCVCKLWDCLISSSTFMDWKKLYYRIKNEDVRAVRTIKDAVNKFGLRTVEDAFKVFIKYMGEGFSRKPSKNMYQFLIKNQRAVNAELVLAERFPDLCKKDSKPWSVFAVAILLSETVWDVYSLYQTLCDPSSDCSLHDITNALYCAASFLLYFRNTLHLNYGLHYRVYYVIYMIENTLPSKGATGTQSLKVPKGLPGQQSIHSFCDSSESHLTYEQLRILNHCIQPKQVVKIVALAGTGKTTTLIHLARLYPQVKFLNIMYNKAICEEAKKRFPGNVECRTAHSLAYASEGARLRYKLTTKIKPHDIVTFLQHNKSSSCHIFAFAKHVLSSIEAFTFSDDFQISLNHVPTLPTTGQTPLPENDRQKILKDTKSIWSKMIDPEDKSVKITHDIYLKLYQLSKPNLSRYQCIMVDEAQDCNPAILSVVLTQNVPVILVGDPNQQIYAFRGADNALQNVSATHTYHLTKSFRFGPEIAYVASSCLENLKHITTHTLVGNEKPSYVNGKTIGQYAIIARTNVSLFNEAVRLCCHKRIKEHEPSTINGAFVGGFSGYGFQQLLDICKLANCYSDQSHTITDKFISKFKTYEELTNYAKNADDSDLLSKVELVRLHSNDLPNYVKQIKEKCNHPLQLANVVFTTAHKAKGLEFDTVSLTDDYHIVNWGSLRRGGFMSIESELEEHNIIYVAVTRAKRCLLLSEKLYRVFLAGNEKFEYPVLSKDIAENDEPVKCVNCSEMFTPHTILALFRREIILANGRKISAGALCMKCRTDPKVRTRVEVDPVIMYLDPTDDYAHRSMASLVGPLPNDPPIVHNSFPPFQDMDVVYIINIHM